MRRKARHTKSGQTMHLIIYVNSYFKYSFQKIIMLSRMVASLYFSECFDTVTKCHCPRFYTSSVRRFENHLLSPIQI